MEIFDEHSSFTAWANRWFKYKRIGLSRDYGIALQSQVKYLTKYFGDIAVTEIKPYDVDYVIGEIASCNPYTQKPTAKKTLRDLRNTARNIFDYVVENTYGYSKKTARRTKLPSTAPKKDRRALTAKEIEWVVNEEHRGRLSAIIMTFCGLRSGELIPLEWNDIDFERSLLQVRKSVKKKTTNSYEIKHGTKNGKTRNIPIPEQILPILHDAKQESAFPYICCQCDGSLHSPTSWKKLWHSFNNVLSHQYGSTQQASRNIYHPLGIKKRVEQITPHMFRHTYATLLYTSGVDSLSAQKLLGHASIATTLDIYTHLEEERYVVSLEDFSRFIKKFWGDADAAAAVVVR